MAGDLRVRQGQLLLILFMIIYCVATSGDMPLIAFSTHILDEGIDAFELFL